MRGTLAELAAVAGMPSEPTLRKMIASDPAFEGILKRGSNGDAYEIELEVAARYIIGREAMKEEQQRARQSELAQLGMDLGLTGPVNAPSLSIADRKAMLEEEVIAMKLARMRGELVVKASVEGAISQMLVWHQQQSETFTARLAKRADVPRALQIEISTLVASDLTEFARRLRDMARIGSEGDGDSIGASGSELDDTAV
jgi:hypothetical protein